MHRALEQAGLSHPMAPTPRRGAPGMSLVETTIILFILMLLTGVIAPSITDYVNDAKRVKVKEDCEAIGISIMRLVRDVGCLKSVASDPCDSFNRVDIVQSDGDEITTADIDLATAPDATSPNIDCIGFLNWDLAGICGDTLVSQLVENTPQYPTPATFTTVGSPTGGTSHYSKPWFNYGWRGSYLQSPVSWDPWGNPYVVNTVFLSTARDATNGTGEGERSGGWSHDVFCLSSGANKIYQTPFSGDYPTGNKGLNRIGDDYAYPISGSTH
jgi:type II secretory pathway pseudopilin PulG